MLESTAFITLEFQDVPVIAYSTAGTPYTRWRKVGMPKIPQAILGSIIYLYHSKKKAMAGEDFGGSGFLIGVPSDHIPGKRHTYAVTNWHVACSDGCSVIRLNTRNGGVDVFEFDPSEWFFDSRYDIAVIPLAENSIDPKVHEVTLLASEMFVTRDTAEAAELGSGEDVFMAGRFIDHDGKETNKPAVRFGNISVMPTPIMQSNGKKANSYIIDCHSRTGFSGSPVFVYRTPGFDLNDFTPQSTPFAQKRVLMAGRNLLGLLGIHWAQFPEEWELKDIKKTKTVKQSANFVVEGKYVEGKSGMACVLPAWKIQEVLDMPKLKELRLQQDKTWEEEGEKEPTIPIPESKSDFNPSHKEDFTRLVNEAVKKQPQGG